MMAAVMRRAGLSCPGSERASAGFLEHLLLVPGKCSRGFGYDGLQKHYGALRGLNEFNDCETAVVLGRQLPSLDQVEAIARAYAFATGSEFRSILEESEWYFYRYEGARCASGAGRAIRVEYHSDPWAQRILEQICDAEIAQAVDRVRAIFNRRKIFLLTPRVIDITV